MTFMRNVKTLLSACVKVKQQCFSVIFSRVFTEFHRTERSIYSEKKEEKQTGDAFFRILSSCLSKSYICRTFALASTKSAASLTD